MKTKAEKYAEGYRCPATNENEYCKHDIISAYNNGYTQCQDDMADNSIKFAQWLVGDINGNGATEQELQDNTTSELYTLFNTQDK